MTEENMKKLYEHFVASGQKDKAKEIVSIPRYAKFGEKKVELKETNSKKVK